IVTLPEEFIKLTTLESFYCKTRAIPEVLCHMPNLKEFHYDYFTPIKQLPPSIDKLFSKGFIDIMEVGEFLSLSQ
ncbi:MAG: hypothetical protein LGB53_01640, partial [Sulfurovum sp.]|nr:hypothetical protein [Sulfurovum sp.]